MAKKKPIVEIQNDMFPVDPAIRGLAITEFKVNNGNVIANLTGATLVNDVAQFDQETWPKAIAEWLVNLCGNNGELIDGFIDQARQHALEVQRDREALQNAMANVKNFPAGSPTLA